MMKGVGSFVQASQMAWNGVRQRRGGGLEYAASCGLRREDLLPKCILPWRLKDAPSHSGTTQISNSVRKEVQ
jgi:hypothetical protein